MNLWHKKERAVNLSGAALLTPVGLQTVPARYWQYSHNHRKINQFGTVARSRCGLLCGAETLTAEARLGPEVRLERAPARGCLRRAMVRTERLAPKTPHAVVAHGLFHIAALAKSGLCPTLYLRAPEGRREMCGRERKGNVPAFQAGNAGSNPVVRAISRTAWLRAGEKQVLP